MILAIYKRNKPKDKWYLSYIAPSYAAAQTHSKTIEKEAKQSGFDQAETIVQAFASEFDIPETLTEAKPERLLLS